MIRLFVVVEENEAVMDAGYTVIRVYTDTSSSGDFTTLDGTITLVTGRESYEYTDLEGVAATWYKTVYYGAGTGEGTKSTARKGETSAAYGTVKELRALISLTAITDDVELAMILDGAARAINRYCNRPTGFVAEPDAVIRTYAGSGKTYQLLDEYVSITLVEVKASATSSTYDSWTTADWIAFSGKPTNPDFNTLPYDSIMIDPTGDESIFTSGAYTTRAGFRPTTDVRRGVPTVRVTGRWGYSSTIPHDIKMANLMQAARWYKRMQSSMADALASGELGQLFYVKALDPDIENILDNGRYVIPAS